MLEKYSVRTDLALEEKERFESDHVEIQGVILEEDYDKEKEIRITRVKIETEKGAKAMGKPVGTYITLEAPNMAVPDTDYHREVSEKIAGFVQELLKAQNVKTEELSVLIVGLGNRQVTPDALGPHVVDNLAITRHIVKEYGKYTMGEDAVCDKAYCQGVRKICDGNAACESGQHTGSGCDGTDGNGNCRGGPWCGKRNETGSCDCSGCAGSKKQSEIKPYDPDRRYRNPSGFRSGKSQKRNYQRIHRSSGDRDRSSDSCGCGNHCQ